MIGFDLFRPSIPHNGTMKPRPIWLVPVTLVCALLWQGSSADGAGAPLGAVEGEVERKPIQWSLVQVGPEQRSVEVHVAWGGCESDPVGTASESANKLRITVTTESPTDPHVLCLADA